MKRIEHHPEIIEVQDFLSETMCNHFIEKGELVSFEEAKINVGGRQMMAKGVRNNQRILFKDETLAAKIWTLIKPFTVETVGTYKVSGLNEMFRIYKYEVGQQFRMHHDGSYRRNEKECSFYSFLIYLNDDFEGGETYFEQGTTIIPKMGNALLFHHSLRHEGKTIVSGVKYVLRTDIMYTRPQ